MPGLGSCGGATQVREEAMSIWGGGQPQVLGTGSGLSPLGPVSPRLLSRADKLEATFNQPPLQPASLPEVSALLLSPAPPCHQAPTARVPLFTRSSHSDRPQMLKEPRAPPCPATRLSGGLHSCQVLDPRTAGRKRTCRGLTQEVPGPQARGGGALDRAILGPQCEIPLCKASISSI